jgi:hypothetical protein
VRGLSVRFDDLDSVRELFVGVAAEHGGNSAGHCETLGQRIGECPWGELRRPTLQDSRRLAPELDEFNRIEAAPGPDIMAHPRLAVSKRPRRSATSGA